MTGAYTLAVGHTLLEATPNWQKVKKKERVEYNIVLNRWIKRGNFPSAPEFAVVAKFNGFDMGSEPSSLVRTLARAQHHQFPRPFSHENYPAQ